MNFKPKQKSEKQAAVEAAAQQWLLASQEEQENTLTPEIATYLVKRRGYSIGDLSSCACYPLLCLESPDVAAL